MYCLVSSTPLGVVPLHLFNCYWYNVWFKGLARYSESHNQLKLCTDKFHQLNLILTCWEIMRNNILKLRRNGINELTNKTRLLLLRNERSNSQFSTQQSFPAQRFEIRVSFRILYECIFYFSRQFFLAFSKGINYQASEIKQLNDFMSYWDG